MKNTAIESRAVVSNASPSVEILQITASTTIDIIRKSIYTAAQMRGTSIDGLSISASPEDRADMLRMKEVLLFDFRFNFFEIIVSNFNVFIIYLN